MKQPRETDYEIKREGSGVIVIFKPTESSYIYSMLDKSACAKHGKPSKVPNVRHANRSGETDEYSEAEVAEMAYGLAEAFVR
jgi:hypothetical protein